jgi:hypothetical protein
VRVNELRPSPEKESTEDDKEYETDMEDYDRVGEDPIDHVTRSEISTVSKVWKGGKG